MPFVVNGVCRYTVNALVGTKAVANIIDMFIDTTGAAQDRDDAIFDQAGILINEWSDHVLPRLSNSYIAQNVAWVDLDSATGTTGSRNTTGQEVWPQAGVVSSEALVRNAAVLVRKVSTSARGSRNGRMYIGPISESQAAASNLDATALAGWQGDMTSFLGNINQAPLPGTYSSEMVVTHILTRDADGNPLTGNSTPVSTLAVQQLLATQRRRLRS